MAHRTTHLLTWLIVLAVGEGALAPGQPVAAPVETEAPKLCRIKAKGHVNFAALSPDGRIFAFDDYGSRKKDNGVREIWSEIVLVDLATGKELHRRPTDLAVIPGGVFSPDGKLLALGSCGKVAIWDVEQCKQVRLLESPQETSRLLVAPYAFSPDGKRLVGAALSSSLVLWELETGRSQYLETKWARSLGAVRFGEQVDPLLFVESHNIQGGPQTDIYSSISAVPEGKSGRPLQLGFLRTEYAAHHIMLLGRGIPFLGSPHERFRFRLGPAGGIAVLPRYDRLPIGAVTNKDGTVAVLATESGKELHRLQDLQRIKAQTWCFLSTDGKKLVAIGDEPPKDDGSVISVVIVWDVSRLLETAGKDRKRPAPPAREDAWDSLAHESLDRAHSAMLSLVAHPKEAVPLLRERFGAPPDPKRVPQLIAELDNDDFKTRQRASQELERLGQAAEGPLKEAMKKNPSADKRKWLEDLLAKIQPTTAAAHELRLLRIIDVLEHIPTTESRELLQTIGDGGYGPAFAAPAKEALDRAAKKKPKD